MIISILNEKIEDMSQFFNELKDIFTIIFQFYVNTSSKKVAELSKEILSILNGTKKPVKSESNSINVGNIFYLYNLIECEQHESIFSIKKIGDRRHKQ